MFVEFFWLLLLFALISLLPLLHFVRPFPGKAAAIIVVFVAAMYLAFVTVMDMQGRPLRFNTIQGIFDHLEIPVDNIELLGMKYIEDEAIWLLLDIGNDVDPFYVELPWSLEQAQQANRAQAEAEAEGEAEGTVVLQNPGAHESAEREFFGVLDVETGQVKVPEESSIRQFQTTDPDLPNSGPPHTLPPPNGDGEH